MYQEKLILLEVKIKKITAVKAVSLSNFTSYNEMCKDNITVCFFSI